MRTRTMGIAAPVKISKIVMATINSIGINLLNAHAIITKDTHSPGLLDRSPLMDPTSYKIVYSRFSAGKSTAASG